MLIFLKLIALLSPFWAGNCCCEEDTLIRTCLDVVGVLIVLIQSSLEGRLLMELAQLYETTRYHF